MNQYIIQWWLALWYVITRLIQKAANILWLFVVVLCKALSFSFMGSKAGVDGLTKCSSLFLSDNLPLMGCNLLSICEMFGGGGLYRNDRFHRISCCPCTFKVLWVQFIDDGSTHDEDAGMDPVFIAVLSLFSSFYLFPGNLARVMFCHPCATFLPEIWATSHRVLKPVGPASCSAHPEYHDHQPLHLNLSPQTACCTQITMAPTPWFAIICFLFFQMATHCFSGSFSDSFIRKKPLPMVSFKIPDNNETYFIQQAGTAVSGRHSWLVEQIVDAHLTLVSQILRKPIQMTGRLSTVWLYLMQMVMWQRSYPMILSMRLMKLHCVGGPGLKHLRPARIRHLLSLTDEKWVSLRLDTSQMGSIHHNLEKYCDRGVVSSLTLGFSYNNYKGYRTLAEAHAEWRLSLANETWGSPHLQPCPPCPPTFEPIPFDECPTTMPGMSIQFM